MNSQGGSREEPRRPRTSSGSVLVGEERRHWASDWRVPQLDSLATRLNRAQDGRDADGVGVVGDGRAGEGWIRGAEWFVRSGEMYDGDAGKRMDRARRWMGPQRADLRRGGGATVPWRWSAAQCGTDERGAERPAAGAAQAIQRASAPAPSGS